MYCFINKILFYVQGNDQLKQNIMNDLSKYLHKTSGTTLTLALHVTKY